MSESWALKDFAETRPMPLRMIGRPILTGALFAHAIASGRALCKTCSETETAARRESDAFRPFDPSPPAQHGRPMP
jgi:DNA-binding IclR family transcriptional regulator